MGSGQLYRQTAYRVVPNTADRASGVGKRFPKLMRKGGGPLWGIAFALVYGFYSSFFMGRLYYLRIMILFELGFIKVM